MNKQDIISSGILEQYVLGLTTAEETLLVEQWMLEFDEVAQEVDRIEDTLYELDVQNAVQPSEGLRTNILSQITVAAIETKVVEMPVAKERNWYKFAAAASVAALIGTALFSVSLYKKYNDAQAALISANNTIKDQEKETANLRNQLDVPLNNASQQVVLKGTPIFPESTAKLFYIENTKEVFVEPSGLPEAPKGFQYQLWAIIDGKPVDAGVIEHKGKKYNLQKMKSFGKVTAFAITLEKEGGSPAPTLDKMFVYSEM